MSYVSHFERDRLRIQVSVKRFTPANTGVDKASQYPELGSHFKAASMKSYLWFFSRKAIEIAEGSPSDARFGHVVMPVAVRMSCWDV